MLPDYRKSQVERTIEEFRGRLLLQEADQMRTMARRWLDVEQALESQITLLAGEVLEMRQAGEAVNQARLMRLDRYQRLLAQAKAETRGYANWAASLIAERQGDMLEMGVQGAEAMIRSVYMDAGKLGGYFDVLPIEAVEFATGFAGDGSPLARLLMRDYTETAAQLTQALIDGTALGRNPRETARLMAEAMGGNLDRALTIARTEQIRAYREAGRQSFVESGVVEGYIRRCALSERTCIACLALDGTEYETDELMDVHPNDRCFMQPKVTGIPLPDAISGQRWFEEQDTDIQMSILGPERYDAWLMGQVEFRDFASTHTDPVWGPSVRVTPVGELVN